jgi:hypothetical protein
VAVKHHYLLCVKLYHIVFILYLAKRRIDLVNANLALDLFDLWQRARRGSGYYTVNSTIVQIRPGVAFASIGCEEKPRQDVVGCHLLSTDQRCKSLQSADH